MQSEEEKGRSKKKSLQESKHRSMEKGIKNNRSKKPTDTEISRIITHFHDNLNVVFSLH